MITQCSDYDRTARKTQAAVIHSILTPGSLIELEGFDLLEVENA